MARPSNSAKALAAAAPDDDDDPLVRLGSRVRQAREAARYTQKDVAARIGVSEGTIQRYERGETSIPPQRLIDLGEVLKVPVTFFFETTAAGSAVKDSDAYVAVGADVGARRLVEIYLEASKSVKKQLLAYAEFLAKG